MKPFARIFGAAVLAGAVAGPALAQDVSFAGKTVRILINFGPGSSTDVVTRQFAPFVGKYLPGKPKLIVESKPGGRGGLGAAFMFKNVKPDGMTLGGLSIIVPRMALGAKMPVDLAKFVHVGGVGTSAVYYVRTGSGIESASDLKSTSRKIIIGATGPNVPNVMQLRLLLDEIGQKDYQVIPGYKGQLGMLKAVRSGEVNLAFMITGVWMPRHASFEKEGIVRPILESGVNDTNGVAQVTKGLGLPTLDSLWRKLSPGSVGSDAYKAFTFLQTTRSLIFLYVLPPGTPAKYARVWERAMANGLMDPEHLALLDKNSAPYPLWVDGATSKRLVGEIVRNKNDPIVKAALNTVRVKR